MGKKRRINTSPGKFTNKFGTHPIMKTGDARDARCIAGYQSLKLPQNQLPPQQLPLQKQKLPQQQLLRKQKLLNLGLPKRRKQQPRRRNKLVKVRQLHKEGILSLEFCGEDHYLV